MSRQTLLSSIAIAGAIGALLATEYGTDVRAAGPALVDKNLQVSAVASGLNQPTSFAFIGANDVLVLEKASGRVIRAQGNTLTTVLDLAVNNFSERGLLGIALHPAFPSTPQVFLYWTESTTGSDTAVPADTPVLGNRIDSFVWNGSNLTQGANIIRIRARQEDAGQPPRGNHDGGVIRIGPDNKLYVFVGDLGRRGNLQNLRCGPVNDSRCPPNTPTPDDQFGGPAPDNAHLSGIVLRLNLDGTAPSDNPFFAAGAAMGGEVGANIQKLFSYGHRNSFGMAFDPESGGLWLQENGDDSFSELNRVTAGMDGGWVPDRWRESRSSRRSRRPSAVRTCSSCDGRPRTSATSRRTRCPACSTFRARITRIRRSAGNGKWHPEASASSPGRRLVRSTTAT
jgi:glucose/arabinose dehydrogenase